MKKIFSKAILILAFAMGAAFVATAQDEVQAPADTTPPTPPVEEQVVPPAEEQMEGHPEVEELNQPRVAEPEDNTPSPNKPMGILIAACCATLLLALAAVVMGVLNRREINALRQALDVGLDDANADIKKLAAETARHVNGLNDRLHATQRTLKRPAATPPRYTPRMVEAEPAQPSTFYLGKPDESDCFTRVSDRFELGNSIFMLNTADGIRGTFFVIDNADVHRFALMMPTENLTRACEGEGIQRPAGMTGIVTDTPGEAVMENGQWRIVTKAQIHYTA